MALEYVGAALSVAGALSSFKGQKSEAKARRRAARAQAGYTFETRMEEIRRSQRTIDQQMSRNTAAVYASGLVGSRTGSAMRALQGTRNELNRQIRWDRKAAKLEERAIMSGAPGSSVNRLATGQLAVNLGQIATGLYMAGK